MAIEPILEPVAGKCYMVVDAGGGTVDIAVHQMMDEQGFNIKELHRATGGPFGSIGTQSKETCLKYVSLEKFDVFFCGDACTGIDLAFEQLLDAIFGADFMAHFKNRLPAAHVDLMVAFEARKRHASPLRCNPLNIALPFSFIDCFRKYRGKEVEAVIRKYGDNHIRWSSQGMLRLDQEAMKTLFQPTLNAIIEVHMTIRRLCSSAILLSFDVFLAYTRGALTSRFTTGGYPFLGRRIRRIAASPAGSAFSI